MLARLLLATLVCTSCASSSSDDWPWGPSGKGDYYGNDDRQQIGDARDPRVAGWARSIAIVVNRANLGSAGAGRIAAHAQTLGEKQNLCAGERFADEPAFGFCSSFLVGPDLVATAGHCFNAALCDEMAFVFDFHVGGASADLAAIPASNVYTCKELVARQLGGGLDYALVRLDRAATGRTPFALQATPPAVGARVALLGFPSGIYAKADLAGEVVRVEGHRIRTSVDSFPGHSGGVMIDLGTGHAFGVHVEGSTPSFVGTGECMRVAQCPAVTPDAGYCTGAVETSVDAFASCCTNAPAPAATSCDGRCGQTAGGCACDLACSERGDCCSDVAARCQAGSTARTCLGGGAPCDSADDCADASCACGSERAFTESFTVPGSCTPDGCVDVAELCADACAAKEPVVPGEPFALAWSHPVCELR